MDASVRGGDLSGHQRGPIWPRAGTYLAITGDFFVATDNGCNMFQGCLFLEASGYLRCVAEWSFFTNQAQALVCIAQDPRGAASRHRHGARCH